MRYGLSPLINLVCGVTERTSRILGPSAGFLNLRNVDRDYAPSVPDPPKRVKQSLVVSSRVLRDSWSTSSSPSHHDRRYGAIFGPAASSSSSSSLSSLSFSFASLLWRWQRPQPWQHRSISVLPTSYHPHFLLCLPVRRFSTSHSQPSPDKDSSTRDDHRRKSNEDNDGGEEVSKKETVEEDASKSKGVVQRFHKAYKNYGKVLIGFHCVTYCIYFTSFLGISYAGLDVVSILEWMRDHVALPQSLIDAITHSGAGHFAVAFILCKVISPVRYLTTIVGTKYTADYLRRRGYIAPIPQGDRIGELAKESQKIIEEKSAELRTRISRSGRRLRKVNEVRMRRTNNAVGDLRSRMRLGKRTPKR